MAKSAVGLLVTSLAAALLLSQICTCCFWIFKGKEAKNVRATPIEFTACVFNNSADFDCIHDCVYVIFEKNYKKIIKISKNLVRGQTRSGDVLLLLP